MNFAGSLFVRSRTLAPPTTGLRPKRRVELADLLLNAIIKIGNAVN